MRSTRPEILKPVLPAAARPFRPVAGSSGGAASQFPTPFVHAQSRRYGAPACIPLIVVPPPYAQGIRDVRRVESAHGDDLNAGVSTSRKAAPVRLPRLGRGRRTRRDVRPRAPGGRARSLGRAVRSRRRPRCRTTPRWPAPEPTSGWTRWRAFVRVRHAFLCCLVGEFRLYARRLGMRGACDRPPWADYLRAWQLSCCVFGFSVASTRT